MESDKEPAPNIQRSLDLQPAPPEQRHVTVFSAIEKIPAAEWDRCANPSPQAFNPFVSHAFLLALEQSGCVSANTGWRPQHLVLRDPQNNQLGCMPCYIKTHSQGEYVFDHGWAEAFENAGGDYYPKLQSAVPFTPVTGSRLLVPEVADKLVRETQLVDAALQLSEKRQLSSVHLTFLPEAQARHLAAMGFLLRTDQQFHWDNDNYRNFSHFLSALAARKRKSIRKERAVVHASGVSFEWLTGDQIQEQHWDLFFQCYQDTGSRKWGQPYLNRQFFRLIGETMADRILLVMCRFQGQYIAGALNFIGGDTLYGRYWGCLQPLPFLHFETCYYQAIEYAIANGLKAIEAGAQGAHKLARGYLPQTTYSAHHIAHPDFRRAVAAFLEQERRQVALESELLTAHSPFSQSPKQG